MKLAYEISKIALNDLDEIWNYTAKEWSVNQANTYYKQILSTSDQICSNPDLGRTIDEIKQGHRGMNTNFHMIIYKTSKTKLYVDRILHQKMDLRKQLKE